MLLARTQSGYLTTAEKHKDGYCPSCGDKLIAKCGEINVHHWSHRVHDCDPWHENESLWHYEWKVYFGLENCEKVIGNHRADVVRNGQVIELQNSPIDPSEIIERESFYGDMIWIFNATGWANNIVLNRQLDKSSITFRWKHPRKSIWFCRKPVYLDLGFGNFLFRIRKVYSNIPCGGYGEFFYAEEDGFSEAEIYDDCGDCFSLRRRK